MDLFKLVGKVTVDIADATAKLGDVQKSANTTASKIGSAMKTTGGTLTKIGKALMPLSVAVGGVGVAAAKMSMDFEDSMAKVSTIMDDTEISYDDMKQAIVDLSNQTGISANKIADNVYNAISAGQKTGDAVNFVTNSTKLAKAGFADAGDALDILTTIMNAYGLEAGKVTNVSDMLIQTQNLGKTTVAELASSMGKVIPTANAYGVQLDQLCTGYALMTSNGVATAESTTYMNSMLNELGKSGTTVSVILQEKTGKSFSELMKSGSSLDDVLSLVNKAAKEQGLAFSDVWSSSEAAKAGLILLGDGADEFNGKLNEMNNSTGATDTAFAKLQTSSERIGKALNVLKNTMIELGGTIMEVAAPYIEAFAQKVSELSTWFTNLDENQKKVIVAIGGAIAIATPLLVTIGTLISAIGTIVAAINPVTVVIGAVIAAGVGLITHWGSVSATAAELAQSIKKKFTEIRDNIRSKIESARDIVSGAVGKIKSFLSFSGLREKVSGIYDGIKTAISNKIESSRDKVNGAVERMKSFLSFSGLTSTVSSVFNRIKEGITNKIESARDKVKGAIDKIKGFFNFHWSLPALKLPHFTISGRFSLNPPSVPHFGISWYKKAMEDGMILNSPSIFGFDAKSNKFLAGGEAGSETVVGTKSLMTMINEASSSGNSALLAVLKEIRNYLADEKRWYNIMLSALADGSLAIILDGREVGRVVKKYA